MPANLPLIRKRLHETQELLDKMPASSSTYRTYPELCAAVIHMELQEEVTFLTEWVSNADEANFVQRFKERCLQRAQRNQQTLISYEVMPEGICNQLYWDLADLTLGQQTWSDRLAVLMPYVTHLIDIQKETDITLKIYKKSIKTLNQLAKLNELSGLIVDRHLVLQIDQVADLSFAMHQQFYNQIKILNPDLVKKIYTHNEDFKTLYRDLQRINYPSAKPYEVIKALINTLRLGGSKVTGNEFASHNAARAYLNFKEDYLALLPPEIKTPLLDLAGSGYNIHYVMEHLRKGRCVEQAADYLESVLTKHKDSRLLNEPVGADPKILQEIKNSYQHKKLIQKTTSFVAEHDEKGYLSLPADYLKKLFVNVSLDDGSDYLNWLLFIPHEFYNDLLTYAKFTFSESLAILINSGFLNDEQVQKLLAAVNNNVQKLNTYSIDSVFSITLENNPAVKPSLTDYLLDHLLLRLEHGNFEWSPEINKFLISKGRASYNLDGQQNNNGFSSEEQQKLLQKLLQTIDYLIKNSHYGLNLKHIAMFVDANILTDEQLETLISKIMASVEQLGGIPKMIEFLSPLQNQEIKENLLARLNISFNYTFFKKTLENDPNGFVKLVSVCSDSKLIDILQEKELVELAISTGSCALGNLLHWYQSLIFYYKNPALEAIYQDMESHLQLALMYNKISSWNVILKHYSEKLCFRAINNTYIKSILFNPDSEELRLEAIDNTCIKSILSNFDGEKATVREEFLQTLFSTRPRLGWRLLESDDSKIEYLKAAKYIKVSGNSLIVNVKDGVQYCFYRGLIEKLWTFAHEQRVDSLHLLMSPPKHDFNYQKTVTTVIENLTTGAGTYFQSILIEPETGNNELSYMSSMAKPAAEALRKHGKHLRSIRVKANDNGSLAFAQTCRYLYVEGSLETCHIAPINTWDQVTSDIISTLPLSREIKSETSPTFTNPVLEPTSSSVDQAEVRIVDIASEVDTQLVPGSNELPTSDSVPNATSTQVPEIEVKLLGTDVLTGSNYDNDTTNMPDTLHGLPNPSKIKLKENFLTQYPFIAGALITTGLLGLAVAICFALPLVISATGVASGAFFVTKAVAIVGSLIMSHVPIIISPALATACGALSTALCATLSGGLISKAVSSIVKKCTISASVSQSEVSLTDNHFVNPISSYARLSLSTESQSGAPSTTISVSKVHTNVEPPTLRTNAVKVTEVTNVEAPTPPTNAM